MSASDSPGPDPSVTPGLERGGGVAPGDTPPMSDSMSAAAHEPVPNQGPVAGNRTPMVVTLVLLAVVVLLCAGLVVASLVSS
ncbi:MAG: DUF6480 family protein [Mycobacteriales bacterium]